jgi:hypothetical protein
MAVFEMNKGTLDAPPDNYDKFADDTCDYLIDDFSSRAHSDPFSKAKYEAKMAKKNHMHELHEVIGDQSDIKQEGNGNKRIKLEAGEVCTNG